LAGEGNPLRPEQVQRAGYAGRTPNAENFDEAVLVLDSLGDPDGPACTVLANRTGHDIGSYLKAIDLEPILEL
jgi:hypothetical protein